MDEEYLDTLAIDQVEIGDRIQYMDPEDGSWIIDTVTEITDNGETFDIRFEDRDESLTFDQSQHFDQYGYSVVEV